MILPIIATGLSFTTFGTILKFITVQIKELNFLFRYAIIIYFLVSSKLPKNKDAKIAILNAKIA